MQIQTNQHATQEAEKGKLEFFAAQKAQKAKNKILKMQHSLHFSWLSLLSLPQKCMGISLVSIETVWSKKNL